RALDPHAVADLADREGLAYARTLAPDDHTLEHLHALLVALDDADVHLQGVARGEVRNVVAHVDGVDEIGRVHGASTPEAAAGDPAGYVIPTSCSKRPRSSADRPPRAAMRSGRCSIVRASAWARRHRATRA